MTHALFNKSLRKQTSSTLSIFLFAVLLLNCTSYPFQETTPLPADRPITIAIVPCVVEALGQPKFTLTQEEINAIESGLSYSLQREIYDRLFEYADRHHPQNLNIQAISETNALLEINGISLQEGWELPITDLATVLEVDFVFKLNIRNQLGNRRSIIQVFDNPGPPICEDNYTQMSQKVFLKAGLFDASSGLPLWSIGDKRYVTRGKKHPKIAKRLVGQLGPELPAFLQLHTLSQSE